MGSTLLAVAVSVTVLFPSSPSRRFAALGVRRIMGPA